MHRRFRKTVCSTILRPAERSLTERWYWSFLARYLEGGPCVGLMPPNTHLVPYCSSLHVPCNSQWVWWWQGGRPVSLCRQPLFLTHAAFDRRTCWQRPHSIPLLIICWGPLKDETRWPSVICAFSFNPCMPTRPASSDPCHCWATPFISYPVFLVCLFWVKFLKT